MPVSEAAMDGIKANGHKWRATIRLGIWPELLGKYNDQQFDGETVDEKLVEKAAQNIVAAIRSFARGDSDEMADLRSAADDLESVEDCSLDEVNYAMGRVYDCFDYWRILVLTAKLSA